MPQFCVDAVFQFPIKICCLSSSTISYQTDQVNIRTYCMLACVLYLSMCMTVTIEYFHINSSAY